MKRMRVEKLNLLWIKLNLYIYIWKQMRGINNKFTFFNLEFVLYFVKKNCIVSLFYLFEFRTFNFSIIIH